MFFSILTISLLASTVTVKWINRAPEVYLGPYQTSNGGAFLQKYLTAYIY